MFSYSFKAAFSTPLILTNMYSFGILTSYSHVFVSNIQIEEQFLEFLHDHIAKI